MTAAAFPTLPQPASMRATEGLDTEPEQKKLEGGNDGDVSPPFGTHPALPEPAEMKASVDHQVIADLIQAEGAQGDEDSPVVPGEGKVDEQRSDQKKVPRAPRPPPKPTPKEGSVGGPGVKDDSDRPSLSARKIAKLRKRFARASVDVNVEMDPTARFSRSSQILGKGSSKVVYKGFDRHQGMEVAWNQVKIPGNLTPRAKARLMNEIEVLKRLKHKSIMKFYTSWIDTQQNHLNFITEYFHPGPLRRHRRAHKCMPRNVLKRWAWQILQGLVYLHGHQPPIIHRDLKCDNIFIHGVTGEVKIGDLGLAKLMEEGLSTCQSVLGTPEFMAPELYHGIYNEKVDIYAYGMCLLELVSMQFPYMECKNRAQIFRHVSMGIHPASLAKIEDTECREFIELCINHFHERRPSSRQLVKHPFFDDIRANQPSGPREHHIPLKKVEPPKPPRIKKIKPKRTFEIQRREVMPHSTKLRLELSMITPGSTKLFMFQFDLDTDTVDAVAMELQEEFGLTHEETQQFTDLLAGEIESRMDEERRDTMRDIKVSLGPLDDLTGTTSEEGQEIGAVKNVEDMSDESSENGEDNVENDKMASNWTTTEKELGTRTQHIDQNRSQAGLASFDSESAVTPLAQDPYGVDSREKFESMESSPLSSPTGAQDTYAKDDEEYDSSPYQPTKNNPFSPLQGAGFIQGVEEKKDQLFEESTEGSGAYVTTDIVDLHEQYDSEKPVSCDDEPAPPGAQYMDRIAAGPIPGSYPGPYVSNNALGGYRGAETRPQYAPEQKASGCAACTPWCGSMWDGGLWLCGWCYKCKEVRVKDGPRDRPKDAKMY